MTQATASIPTFRGSSRSGVRRTNTATQWLPPIGLIVLSLIPVIAGIVDDCVLFAPTGRWRIPRRRVIVGSLMLASIVLAVLAICRREFASHGAWMTRAYAIALGAGTQVLTMLPWVVIVGPIGASDELPRTVLMTAAWVINLGVAEYVIRRRRGQRPNRTSAGLGRSVTADALAT